MRYASFLLLFFVIACESDARKKVEIAIDQVNKSDLEKQENNEIILDSLFLKEEEKAKENIGSLEKKQPQGDWLDLSILIPEAKLDIRYATTNNFVNQQLYNCPTCWMRPDAALALKKVELELKTKGYGLVLFDCYRPRPVQQALWDIMPNAAYVTPPSKGSMHNRGKAVDLSLTDLEGNQLDMGTAFDFFGRAAHSDNRNHPVEILDRRDLLNATMKKFGFRGIRTEWWHFSFGGKPAPLSAELWECD